ncbi:MAG: hypothetical protein WCD35_00915 [Mycobacteriales bacterium]
MTTRTTGGVLLVGLFLLFLLTADYGAQSIDTVASATPAWHLAVHGTPWLEGVLPPNPWYVVGSHGHLASNRFPGTVLLAVPFYWLMRSPTGVHVPAFPAAVCAALVTAGAMTALFATLARLHGHRLALGATLVLALATPTWSVSGAALWTHGPAQLCFALALLACARERSPSPWLGFAVLVRPQLVVVGGVMMCHQVLRRDLRAARSTAAGLALGAMSFLLWNRWLYGRWSIHGGYDLSPYHDGHPLGGMPTLPLGLFSPERGLVVLSPFLLLLLPGLRAAWRECPWWCRSAALGGAASFILTVFLVDAQGGDSFYGYRHPLESLVLATPLLVRSFELTVARSAVRLQAFTLLVAVSAALISVGAVFYVPTSTTYDPWTTLDAAVLVQQHGLLPVLSVGATAAAATLAAGVALGLRSAGRKRQFAVA